MHKTKITRSLSHMLAAGLLCVGICGCSDSDATYSGSTKSGSPETVLLNVLDTLQSGNGSKDFLNANCTEDCARVWSGCLRELEKELSGVTFSVQSTYIDGDVATVFVNWTGGARPRNGTKFLLKKIGGRWKVMLN